MWNFMAKITLLVTIEGLTREPSGRAILENKETLAHGVVNKRTCGSLDSKQKSRSLPNNAS